MAEKGEQSKIDISTITQYSKEEKAAFAAIDVYCLMSDENVKEYKECITKMEAFLIQFGEKFLESQKLEE